MGAEGPDYVTQKQDQARCAFWGSVLAILVGTCQVVLATVMPVSEAPRIRITSPDVTTGVVHHGSFSLTIEGEVVSESSVQGVTVSRGRVALGSRGFGIERRKEERSHPFRASVLLDAGENTIEVVAQTEDGREATLAFTAVVEVSPTGSAYALVVAVDDYADPRITDLRFAEADAYAIRDALTDPQYGIVHPQNVLVLAGTDATYRNITRAFEDHLVRKATRAEDIVFFFFAGHGAEGPHVNRGSAYYLIPRDAEAANLLSTGLDKSRLQFLWSAIPAVRKVFITDACHSGGLADMSVLSVDGLEAVEGFVTLAAARADQRSWELTGIGHGIFTHSLVKGLTGSADKTGDGDGYASATEVADYLHREVTSAAAQIGADQTPMADFAPGARDALLATMSGRPLPPWVPQEPAPIAPPPRSLVKVSMKLGQDVREPHCVVALRDEEGDLAASRHATESITAAILARTDRYRFLEPGAVRGRLSAEKAELAFSDLAGELAAVARAVSADLILTGTLQTVSSGVGRDEMIDLIGTTIASQQAQLSLKVVSAYSGEILAAITSEAAAVHVSEDVARRKAVGDACAVGAERVLALLGTAWGREQARRPAGILTVEGMEDYESLGRLEAALVTVEPVRDLRWHGLSADGAVYTFDSEATVDELAGFLRAEFSGFEIARIEEDQAQQELILWVRSL